MSEITLINKINIDDVPSMPQVATEIMRLVGDPDSNASQIAKVIAQDQSMTARILQVANSPFYGRSKSVNTVQDAVVLIGYPAVKGLVISSSTRHIMKNPGLLEALLWDHSIGAAFAAHEIARATKRLDPDEAFTAGLLHDIGRVVMSAMSRDRYVRVMKEVYNANAGPSEILAEEEKVYGYSHPDLGSLIAQKWRLSEDLRIAVQYHHVTEQALKQSSEAEQYGSETALIVCLANLFQYRLGIGIRMPIEFDVSEHIAATLLKLQPGRINQMLLNVKKTFDEQKKHFEII